MILRRIVTGKGDTMRHNTLVHRWNEIVVPYSFAWVVASASWHNNHNLFHKNNSNNHNFIIALSLLLVLVS